MGLAQKINWRKDTKEGTNNEEIRYYTSCIMYDSMHVFYYFFGDTAYQKWQEYNFQSEVKKVVEDGDKSELAKNSSVKAGWLGDKYVKVYSPNLNTEQSSEIKERLNDVTKD